MTAVPSRQAMSRFTAGDHVCVAFDTSDELLEAVAENARCALDNGEKAVCYTAQFMPIAVEATLETYDVRMREGIDRGQVIIAGAHEAFVGTGRFDPDNTISAWREAIAGARSEGFSGLRVVADMSWADGSAPGSNRIAWYEAELNRLFAAGFATVLCMYDRRLFTQAQLNMFAASHTGAARGDTAAPPQLRLSHTVKPRGLRLRGEADIATREALDAVLAGLPEDVPGHGPLVIDLSELTFADVGTITSLVRAAELNPGTRFTGAEGMVGQLLTLVAQFEGVPLRIEDGRSW